MTTIANTLINIAEYKKEAKPFFQILNAKTQSLPSIKYAMSLLKNRINGINIGEAVVNVLGNTGIAGFKFHVPEKEQVKMQNDVTDHYVDTNSPVQDHVARKPITITLNGFQGDYFYSVNKIEDTLAKVIPTLSLVKQFLPRLPDSTKQRLVKKYQQVTQTQKTPLALQNNGTEYTLNSIDLFKLFQDLYKLKSPQTRAFFFLETLWRTNAVFTVETTWKRYNNMLITDITPIRDNNADITEFSVSFKQINFTASLVQNINNATGRTRQQFAKMANKGVDKGTKKETI